MVTVLVFAEVGCSVVEVFEPIVGMLFLVWRRYEAARFVFESIGPIRKLGRGWSR